MYIQRSIPLSPGQIASLRAAVNADRGVTLRVDTRAAGKSVPLLLTQTQVAHLEKTRRAGSGAELKLSKTQVAAMRRDGGIFPLLAAAVPALIAAAKFAAPAIATGALSGAAGYGVRRALGSGFRLGPPRYGGGPKKRR